MNEEEMKRKEKLAGLLFNLANTSFGGAVIGVLMAIAIGSEEMSILKGIVMLIFGTIITIIFSSVAYSLLKEEEV